MFEVKVNGKLQASFMCDKCHKVFAFENGELLQCPKCKGRGFPMNLDPDKGESKIIMP